MKRAKRCIGMGACVAALMAAAGCGPRATPNEEKAPDRDPWAADRGAFADAVARAKHNEGADDGVAAALHAGDIAVRLAAVLPNEPWAARAEEQYTFASKRKALRGACDASVALAQFYAADPGRIVDAYRTAFRTVKRFEHFGDEERCVAEAMRMMTLLDAWKPGSAELSAIAADPDEGDPTSHRAPPATFADVGAWIASEGHATGDVRVSGVEVFGGDADHDDAVRVVLSLSGVARFEAAADTATADGRRVIELTLPQVSLGGGVPSDMAVQKAGVGALHFVPGAQGLRVRLEVESDTAHRVFFLPEPYRIIIDLDRRNTAAAEGEGRRPLRVLVLDPGHGGDDFGARYGGQKEALLVLDITRRVGGILERRMPNTKVLQTRTKDVMVSLEQRVAFANAAGADAFISIHLNAADEPVERGGVATFILDTNNDRQAVRLAARENGTSSRDVSELSRILAGIHRREQVTLANELASLVQTGTLAAARSQLPTIPDRGVKSAMFYVLVGATMPAILVEASFMTKDDENAALRTERYRQALAEGIAEGIVRYARSQE